MVSINSPIPVWFLFWLIIDFSYIFFWVYLWQIKEYRWDRMRAHLGTGQGKKDLLFWRLRKPKFTPKALAIIFLALITQAFFIKTYRFFPKGALFIFAYFFGPLFVALAVALMSLPSRYFKRRIIKQAKKKIRLLSSLKVIGITGSFGKTSTKEYLAMILKNHFRILATRGHNNTDIGVARQVINKLKKEHQIYIVEMGAYKKGEIAAICGLVKPQIGVVTGLGFQHLALFGSPQNLLEAKYELIDSLPGNGLIVLNGDNKLCLEFARRTALKKIIYSLRRKKADFTPERVKVFPQKAEIKLKKGRWDYQLQTSLLGKQNISNLLAAIVVADYLGVPMAEIVKQVAKIKPLPGTMKLIKSEKGINLVDDSYNSNPEGVLAALDYLKVFSGKKIIVLQPLIELGRATFGAHRRVLKRAARVCDLIFLTNRNYRCQIMAGAEDWSQKKIKVAKSPHRVMKDYFSDLKKGDVILFEGREAQHYLKLMK